MSTTTQTPDADCQEKFYDGQSLRSFMDHVSGKRILDVGCGSGNLGAFLEANGNECVGITISEEEAESARRKMTQVEVGNVDAMEAWPFSERSFDVIVFADVLEHLRDAGRVLRMSRAYLKPNGLVIASLPNVANFVIRWRLLIGRFEYEPFGIMDDTHVKFYTLKTARALLENSGFRIQETKYTNWNWVWPKPVVRALSFCEWEIRQRMTRWWPGAFATQFVFFASAGGPVQ